VFAPDKPGSGALLTMAKKTQVVITCDVHDGDAEAVATVRFVVEGTTYEFELCEPHLDEFRSTMEGWSAHARRVGRPAAPAQARPSGRRSAAKGKRRAKSGASTADVRSWAESQGITVSSRGRISSGVREAYDTAHGG
jgi:hypothetical protein